MIESVNDTSGRHGENGRTVQRVVAWHNNILTSLDDIIDIDAGLREILIPTRHEVLLEDLGKILDIEAGLAAIVSTQDKNGGLVSSLPHLTLGRELEILSLSTKLRLRSTCVQTIGQAALAVNFVSDEFEALLCRKNLLAASQPPVWRTREAGNRSILAVKSALRVALDKMALKLDDEVFDAFRDMVETIERQRPNELDLAAAWINNVYDDYWQTGHGIIQGIQRLEHLLYVDLEGSIDWFGRIQFSCADLHAQLSDFVGELISLEEMLNDFAGADLRLVDLADLDLAGLHWSTATQWPPSRREDIYNNSVALDGGIFEVRTQNVAKLGMDEYSQIQIKERRPPEPLFWQGEKPLQGFKDRNSQVEKYEDIVHECLQSLDSVDRRIM